MSGENAVGVKRQKTKFGRSQLRNVTRTTRRPNQEDPHVSSGNSDNDEDMENYDNESEDDDEVKRKVTIATKRNNRNENAFAYSALVTLLKSEHEEGNDDDDDGDDDGADAEEKRKATGIIEADDDADDNDDKENKGDFEEDLLDDEEKAQDDIDVLNKYDSFNLHFNQEEEIAKVIDKYESLSSGKKSVKLIGKEEIANSEEKYFKYRYGYPSVNPELVASSKSGTTLSKKLKYHNVKKRVVEHFEKMDVESLDTSLIESMLTYETINFQYLNNERIKEKYQDYYLLHVMNHLTKTRDRVLNNNEKKALYEKKMREGADVGEEPEFRDQGYTRPKILILLPSRNFAYTLVTKLINTLQMESVENKRKFKTQFYDDSKVSDRVFHSKPKDFEEHFDGNTNDMFVFGIKYTRKTLKLYSPLEQSDIIIASPIGLLRLFDKINTKAPKKKLDKVNKENDIGLKNNFLSSIEICILDKAEGMMMQNWGNVTDLLNKHLNATPKDFMNVDFSRIRMWAIDGQSEYLTQIMTFSKYSTPEMISLVKRSKNLMSGSTSFVPIEERSVIDSLNYKMYQMGLINKYERLKQVFMRFEIDLKNLIDEPNKRFEFFKNVILPQIQNKSSYKYGTLIYIPNYFDYLRIKKFLNDETSVSFVAIDEYLSTSKLTRNRALFHNKSPHARIMLYTERLHFYKRFDIKGVRNVVFYQLPTDPDFYQQVLEFIGNEKLRVNAAKAKLPPKSSIEDQNDNDDEDDDDDDEDDSDEDVDLNMCMVRTIYSKLDAMRFSAIVGSSNASKLSNGESEITEFS